MTKQQIAGMSQIYVSTHFTLAEVLHTERPELQSGLQACDIKNIQFMAGVMEAVRLVLERPIIVSSWFRSPALNKAVGGVRNSAHLYGLAVDFEVSSTEFRRVANAKVVDYDQAIYYPSRSFMHLGYRLNEYGFPSNRRQIIYKK